MPHKIEFADIVEAAQRLDNVAFCTPMLESELLNRELGARLLLKAECLQRTGSFKLRGAFNRLSRIPPENRGRGVVAYSSGNHAQGVAYAAYLLGIRATIVMPRTAPQMKKANTRQFGAQVVEYDIDTQCREALGMALVEETGATLVKPYDDVGVIAGQGTVGLEIAAEMTRRELPVDQLVCPCGGGGLLAGVSIAVHETFPECEIVSSEPENFDDTARSLRQGTRAMNEAGHHSICDAILTPQPGEITFPINRRHVSAGVAVRDDDVLHAMRIAFERFKIVLEPGGAVALAAVLSGYVKIENRCTVVVCSGGNVDASLFARCLE